MNTDNQVQDVVDAIERELFIRVKNGYGVQHALGTYHITFEEVLDNRDLDAVEDVAYDYAPLAKRIFTNKGGGQFVSSMMIVF